MLFCFAPPKRSGCERLIEILKPEEPKFSGLLEHPDSLILCDLHADGNASVLDETGEPFKQLCTPLLPWDARLSPV